MSTSQNGWPLLSREQCVLIEAGGRRFSVAPDVADVFQAFLMRYVVEVEPIHSGQLDDWGFNDRPIGSTKTPSNHWSGTAIDINALKHVQGSRGTYAPGQMLALRRLLADFPMIKWGGDFKRTPDEMHFEARTPSEWKRGVLAMSQRRAPERADFTASDVWHWQARDWEILEDGTLEMGGQPVHASAQIWMTKAAVIHLTHMVADLREQVEALSAAARAEWKLDG